MNPALELSLSLVNSKHALSPSHALPTAHRLYVLLCVCAVCVILMNACGGQRSTSGASLYAVLILISKINLFIKKLE